jgi:hypothetical protein
LFFDIEAKWNHKKWEPSNHNGTQLVPGDGNGFKVEKDCYLEWYEIKSPSGGCTSSHAIQSKVQDFHAKRNILKSQDKG